jgi:hypothetical protein
MLFYCRLPARLPVLALSGRVVDAVRGREEEQKEVQVRGCLFISSALPPLPCTPYITTRERVSIGRERCLENLFLFLYLIFIWILAAPSAPRCRVLDTALLLCSFSVIRFELDKLTFSASPVSLVVDRSGPDSAPAPLLVHLAVQIYPSSIRLASIILAHLQPAQTDTPQPRGLRDRQPERDQQRS